MLCLMVCGSCWTITYWCNGGDYFSTCLDWCNLMDFGFSGPLFTWVRGDLRSAWIVWFATLNGSLFFGEFNGSPSLSLVGSLWSLITSLFGSKTKKKSGLL